MSMDTSSFFNNRFCYSRRIIVVMMIAGNSNNFRPGFTKMRAYFGIFFHSKNTNR